MVFRFALGRSAEVARRFLGDYAGLLQTDCYAGYTTLARWVRYFIDALKVHPSDAQAAEFVRRIDELFAVDREAREGRISQSERAELRREKSTKKVADLRERSEAERHRVLPKSKLGKGVRSLLSKLAKNRD